LAKKHARISVILATLSLTLFIGPVAEARQPADVFKREIMVSAESFPSRFKSDAAFIRYVKKTRKSRLEYPKNNEINLRFMAFFSRPIQATEFTALIYDLTDKGRLVATVPVSPNQRVTRILASSVDLDRDDFPEDHEYRIMIAIGATALAQTRFTIRESARNRALRQAKEKARKKNSKLDFSKPVKKP
jgi:hypothetical protein